MPAAHAVVSGHIQNATRESEKADGSEAKGSGERRLVEQYQAVATSATTYQGKLMLMLLRYSYLISPVYNSVMWLKVFAVRY